MSLKIINDDIVNKERKYVSFSEVYLFSTCPWKHHDSYNLNNREGDKFWGIFGNAIHKAIEDKWKNQKDSSWITMGKVINLAAQFFSDSDGKFPGKGAHNRLAPQEWVKSAFRIFDDFFKFIKKEFPDYELYDIEYELYEPLEGHEKKFKGYIDLILYNPKKDIYEIIDLKTSNYGWRRREYADTKKLYQVILYKDFFCRKEGISRDKVNCHYLILVRLPSKKKKFAMNLYSITSGNRKMSNARDWMMTTLSKIESGIKIKNPANCKYCNCGARYNKWTKKK